MILPTMKQVLEPEHIEYSDDIAVRRMKNGQQNNRVPGNNAIRDIDIEMLGVRGECAGYLLFKPVRWHNEVLDIIPKNHPDLDDFIDIKTVGKATDRLIVQKDDPDHFANVLVDGSQHPTYVFVAWAWGVECKHQEFWDDPRARKGFTPRPAYFVRRNIGAPWHPMEELFPILRDRQKRRGTI